MAAGDNPVAGWVQRAIAVGLLAVFLTAFVREFVRTYRDPDPDQPPNLHSTLFVAAFAGG